MQRQNSSADSGQCENSEQSHAKRETMGTGAAMMTMFRPARERGETETGRRGQEGRGGRTLGYETGQGAITQPGLEPEIIMKRQRRGQNRGYAPEWSDEIEPLTGMGEECGAAANRGCGWDRSHSSDSSWGTPVPNAGIT